MSDDNHKVYRYSFENGSTFDDDLANRCSALFNAHYGVWGEGGDRSVGTPVKNTAQRIRTLVDRPGGYAWLAWNGENLVGYAIGARAETSAGVVSWVTQLVVHAGHQRCGIATTFLQSAWCLSDNVAWGIASANPFAVRSLERATGRRCVPDVVRNNVELFKPALAMAADYLANATLLPSPDRCTIDTKFFVSHAEVPNRLKAISSPENPWHLGVLPAGEEWLAVTFRSQTPQPLTAADLTRLRSASADVAGRAYDRMAIGAAAAPHPWTRHAPHEVDILIDLLKLKHGDCLLDLGCGGGRHAIELARRGFRVVALDRSEAWLRTAKAAADNASVGIDFRQADARSIRLGEEFDAAICLYDVIGSFPDDEDNNAIVETLAAHLRPGGSFALSVMNRVVAEKIAKLEEDVEAVPNSIRRIPASATMEQNGNVWDPNFMLVDRKTGLVYRRERFEGGGEIPIELIVQDRRYNPEELSQICEFFGLKPKLIRPVGLGAWDTALSPDNVRAKEILVVGSRPE